MVTSGWPGALSLAPIMAMSVRILFTRKHTSNGRTPPWYAPDGLKATSNFAVRDSESGRSAQPSEGPSPTHAAAGTLRAVENDAEMAERARACQFYSRGEIPPWLREWHSQHGATGPSLLRQPKFSPEHRSVHSNQHERRFTGTGTS